VFCLQVGGRKRWLVYEPALELPLKDQRYRPARGAEVSFEAVERLAFYDLARTPDVAVVIATGDTRQYANLLLTIGVVGAAPRKEQ
jgi:L-fucose mutarotase/ribose pyranase (RbsD/FucU family)